MKYMGSKSRIAEPILKIIQERADDYGGLSHYIEPFVGGANIIDKVQNMERKYASDKHKYLIALYNNIERISELPEQISREHYSEVRECYNKNLGTFPDWYIGAIGFLSSYNGRFFDGGYAGIVTTKAGTTRNYYNEAKRNLIQQAHLLTDIRFFHKEYTDIKENLEDYIIYCDPPYKDTKQYGISKNFDHVAFWDWARKMSEKNIVLISEQTAPADFECIWEQKVKRTINNAGRKCATEKLFEIDEWSLLDYQWS